MNPDSAMIFAAGFGTRMRDLARDRPKALIPLAGIPLLDRAAGLAREAGIPRLFANAHHHAEQIAARSRDLDLSVHVEAPEILDTGGGLKAALPRIARDCVYTANPDVAWDGPNPFGTLTGRLPDGMDAVLLLVPLDRAIGRTAGDFDMGPGGRLSWGGPHVYTGLQIIRSAAVTKVDQDVFSLRQVWEDLIACGRAAGYLYPGRWCDVGSPEGLARAEAMLAGNA